jgi:hypothetical protein
MLNRTGSILVFAVSYLLSTLDILSAAAPMTVSQLALYQGAGREKILTEGDQRPPFMMSYCPSLEWRYSRKEARHGDGLVSESIPNG